MSQREWIVIRLAAAAMQVAVIVGAAHLELSTRVVVNMLAGAAHIAVIVWHHIQIARMIEAEEQVSK